MVKGDRAKDNVLDIYLQHMQMEKGEYHQDSTN